MIIMFVGHEFMSCSLLASDRVTEISPRIYLYLICWLSNVYICSQLHINFVTSELH